MRVDEITVCVFVHKFVYVLAFKKERRVEVRSLDHMYVRYVYFQT